MQSTRCPRCGATNHQELDYGHYGHCDSCQAVYCDIDLNRDRLSLPGPETYEVTTEGSTLSVSCSANTGVAALSLAFGISMLAMCLVAVVTSLCLAPLVLLITLPFLLIGALLAYYGLAGMYNTTTLRVGPRKTSRHTGPIPVRGNIELATADIQEVFCTSAVVRGKRGHAHIYSVVAVVNGMRKTLWGGVLRADDALWLEQRLAKHLSLGD